MNSPKQKCVIALLVALAGIRVMLAITAVALATHSIMGALQVSGTQIFVAAISGSLLRGSRIG